MSVCAYYKSFQKFNFRTTTFTQQKHRFQSSSADNFERSASNWVQLAILVYTRIPTRRLLDNFAPCFSLSFLNIKSQNYSRENSHTKTNKSKLSSSFGWTKHRSDEPYSPSTLFSPPAASRQPPTVSQFMGARPHLNESLKIVVIVYSFGCDLLVVVEIENFLN